MRSICMTILQDMTVFWRLPTQARTAVEHWLPFVNEQGRLLAPNWGRVHSMWANIAVTPTINNTRLQKFIMKVTAFWGQKIGLNLDDTVFHIKLKRISSPTHWVYDQLHQNFCIAVDKYRDSEMEQQANFIQFT